MRDSSLLAIIISNANTGDSSYTIIKNTCLCYLIFKFGTLITHVFCGSDVSASYSLPVPSGCFFIVFLL